MKDHNYYVYITTNCSRTVLYIGVTNDLHRRLSEHFKQSGKPKTFTGRYYAYHLIYYEWFSDIRIAIAREKQLKRWRRSKKVWLIERVNPEWKFLSEHYWEKHLWKFCGNTKNRGSD